MQEKPLPLYVLQQPQAPVLSRPMGRHLHDERNEKIGFAVGTNCSLFFHYRPGVDENCPSKIAASRFDALFHATECYISKGANMMSDMYALLVKISHLALRAVKTEMTEAREHVAFANTLSGIVMTICSTTAEHSIEHAMSAFHHELPHGAGLIMISEHFMNSLLNITLAMNVLSEWHK
ncbi:MAG: iron-containing alcohol dehydrogenase [Acutalibacteraceae bacterium]